MQRGTKHTEEAKRKMSEEHKARSHTAVNGMQGKIHSEETKRIMSERRIAYWVNRKNKETQ